MSARKVFRSIALIVGVIACAALAFPRLKAVEERPSAMEVLEREFAEQDRILETELAEVRRRSKAANAIQLADVEKKAAAIIKSIDERREATRPAQYEAKRRLRALAGGGIVSQADFDEAQQGTTYLWLSYEIEHDGELVSESNIPGAPQVLMYQWQNADGSVMTAIFQDGKLVSKSQIGLE